MKSSHQQSCSAMEPVGLRQGHACLSIVGKTNSIPIGCKACSTRGSLHCKPGKKQNKPTYQTYKNHAGKVKGPMGKQLLFFYQTNVMSNCLLNMFFFFFFKNMFFMHRNNHCCQPQLLTTSDALENKCLENLWHSGLQYNGQILQHGQATIAISCPWLGGHCGREGKRIEEQEEGVEHCVPGYSKIETIHPAEMVSKEANNGKQLQEVPETDQILRSFPARVNNKS